MRRLFDMVLGEDNTIRRHFAEFPGITFKNL